MDNNDKKELAAKMAAERSKGTQRKALPQGAQQNRGNSLSFFGDDADGWQMSPKTILLCSVAYMGIVILLHIFGKVTSMKTMDKASAAPEEPDTGAGDL